MPKNVIHDSTDVIVHFNVGNIVGSHPKVGWNSLVLRRKLTAFGFFWIVAVQNEGGGTIHTANIIIPKIRRKFFGLDAGQMMQLIGDHQIAFEELLRERISQGRLSHLAIEFGLAVISRILGSVHLDTTPELRGTGVPDPGAALTLLRTQLAAGSRNFANALDVGLASTALLGAPVIDGFFHQIDANGIAPKHALVEPECSHLVIFVFRHKEVENWHVQSLWQGHGVHNIRWR
mmetsp:Transcript_12656/g.35097  ORF Transcript_12656/g.35097 Transcript_12656/m.35097 type:complete len:233 (+) Transcript_12656:3594-4292(+)